MIRQVERSKAVAAARKAKGETANDLVLAVKEHTMTALTEKVRGNATGYKKLIIKLLTEGLERVDEPVVTVECRAEDVDMVNGAIDEAMTAYRNAVKAQYANEPVKYKSQMKNAEACKASVDTSRPLPDKAIGGVKVVGYNGRIVCDNTLVGRLEVVVQELLPAIRATLFPSMRTISRQEVDGNMAESKQH